MRLRPSRPRCEDSAAHLKRHRINFQHREPAKEVLRGVKEVVIVDFRAVAEYPALWVSVRLGRLSFDQVMKRVLPLVRVGQIGIVERDHDYCQRQPRKKQRYRQPVQTDAAGLDGHDFIVLAHDPQRHEDGNQCAQRRQLIEKIGSKVAEIIDHDQKGNAVARNVVE